MHEISLCVCVCVRARARVCMRACARACVCMRARARARARVCVCVCHLNISFDATKPPAHTEGGTSQNGSKPSLSDAALCPRKFNCTLIVLKESILEVGCPRVSTLYTVIPRLTKVIHSVITFVSQNVISRRFYRKLFNSFWILPTI